jgi:DNA-directed RNA polymerase specialized sigma24 family protein
MEAVAATAAPADEALDAKAGDRSTFVALYGPHFEGVYDYVLRVVRDREVATEVVRATFAKAQRTFAEHGNDVTAWLFATARDCALDALRYRRDRNGDVREGLRFTGVDGNRVPDAVVVFDHELLELVWDVAASLSREDYSLLALHARHGLSSEAIGEQLGRDGAAVTRLTRVRTAFDAAVLRELVVRRARHSCLELDFHVRREDRRRLEQHIERCKQCRQISMAFVSPTEVLGALELIEPERTLKREIFGRARRRRVFGIL